jgi:hypothetical protein
MHLSSAFEIAPPDYFKNFGDSKNFSIFTPQGIFKQANATHRNINHSQIFIIVAFFWLTKREIIDTI